MKPLATGKPKRGLRCHPVPFAADSASPPVHAGGKPSAARVTAGSELHFIYNCDLYRLRSI